MRPSAALLRHAESALRELLTFAAPADQTLSRYFREHRELGQKDRAFVAEASFAVLRRRRSLEAAAGSAEPPALLVAALVRVLGLSGRALEGLVDPELVRRIRSAAGDALPDAVRRDREIHGRSFRTRRSPMRALRAMRAGRRASWPEEGRRNRVRISFAGRHECRRAAMVRPRGGGCAREGEGNGNQRRRSKSVRLERVPPPGIGVLSGFRFRAAGAGGQTG